MLNGSRDELRAIVVADISRGTPRMATKTVSISIASSLAILQSTFPARHSRAYLSKIESHFKALPEVVRPNMSVSTELGHGARLGADRNRPRSCRDVVVFVFCETLSDRLSATAGKSAYHSHSTLHIAIVRRCRTIFSIRFTNQMRPPRSPHNANNYATNPSPDMVAPPGKS